MIVRYHFVYQILGMMSKTCQPGVGAGGPDETGTMGVKVLPGGRFDLAYDPDFANSLKDEELTYVFYHEIMHLALHHCTTRRFCEAPDLSREKMREMTVEDLIKHDGVNIAQDLAVNELIPIVPGSCEPPKDKDGKLMGCHVSELKKQKEYSDILEKQTAEWYYDYLRKKSGGKDGQNGKGKIGRFDSHGGWKEDEVSDEKVRARILDIARQDGWGNVGASEKELIMAAQNRRINWRNLIRVFYGVMAWSVRESTRKRPNRRTGLMHPGHKKMLVDRHLVAIDTSGSTWGFLNSFLAVLNSLVDFLPIDVMQFDCEKTEDPKPFDRQRLKFEFKGRGGTSFEPVMKVVEEKHYKSVLIVTDGQAEAPTKPKNARVAWVLPEGCNPPVDWGQRIHVAPYAT
jgi:predicted metal-dependent peptidase